MTIREQIENLIITAVSDALNINVTDACVERPRDESHGDWASSIALRLAKQAHMAPRDIAQKIVDALPENNVIANNEIAGPSFINFRLTHEALQNIIAQVRRERENYGRGRLDDGEQPTSERACDVQSVSERAGGVQYTSEQPAGVQNGCDQHVSSVQPASNEQQNAHSKVNLEYVSANPTGPMHVGHGRWAALGDSLARIMRHAGYDVYEEFYVNDHGVQMDVFANSIVVRYLQLCGQDLEMPEKCYGGTYVRDIAQGILDEDGTRWLQADEQERLINFRERGYKQMLDRVKNTLEGFGTHMDCYFSERDLYKLNADGETAVDFALRAFREQGHVYEKDGATWFKSTDFGDDKDRVLIKADGEMTYFMSDCAYHYNKIQRGYNKLIDIWGADHHGYVKRCEAMLAAWGHAGALEVVLGQLVNLKRNGEAVRMSKRTGEMVTFEELIDEVGVDATRFLMLSRSSDQPIDFDIEVAKKQDASNPVYYVQYAHARICSIMRRAAVEAGVCAAEDEAASMDVRELASKLVPADTQFDEQSDTQSNTQPDASATTQLDALTHPTELALMRKMADFPEFVQLAARDRAPYRATHYCTELAQMFHQFYTNCHVIGEDTQLTRARLALCDATRTVLALTLSLLGVSAPQKM